MTVIPLPVRWVPRFDAEERAALSALAGRMKVRGWYKFEFRDHDNEQVFFVWFDEAPPGHAILAEGCQRLALARRSGGFVLFGRDPGCDWRNVLLTPDFAIAVMVMKTMAPRKHRWLG